MPDNEQAFRKWYSDIAKQYNLDPDPDNPEHFYDYRAAFKAGAKPDSTGHWPSDFKLEGHPNLVVGGFNTKTGEKVGPTQDTPEELRNKGWQSMPDQNEWEITETPDEWELVEEEEKAPEYTGPTTFGGGFKQSLMSGEALDAGLRGGAGFLQGAIADLPASLYGGIKSIGNAIVNPKQAGSDLYEGITSLPGQIYDRYSMAGSEPEEFGRMMGQLTGQPAVTAGVAKMVPKVPAAVGKLGRPLEVVGNVVKREGLASGVLPPFTTPRYLKLAERAAGRGIEKVGQKIQVSKLTSVPKGTTIIVDAKKLSPEKVKMIIDRGFAYKGRNNQGSYRFTRIK